MNDNLFKNDAKQMVDHMFESGLFNENVTRDHMTAFEQLIEFHLKSRFESYLKMEKLSSRIKALKTND